MVWAYEWGATEQNAITRAIRLFFMVLTFVLRVVSCGAFSTLTQRRDRHVVGTAGSSATCGWRRHQQDFGVHCVASKFRRRQRGVNLGAVSVRQLHAGPDRRRLGLDLG